MTKLAGAVLVVAGGLSVASAQDLKYPNEIIENAPKYIHYTVFVKYAADDSWQGGNRQMSREAAQKMMSRECADNDKPWIGNAHAVVIMDTETGSRREFKCAEAHG